MSSRALLQAPHVGAAQAVAGGGGDAHALVSQFLCCFPVRVCLRVRSECRQDAPRSAALRPEGEEVRWGRAASLPPQVPWHSSHRRKGASDHQLILSPSPGAPLGVSAGPASMRPTGARALASINTSVLTVQSWGKGDTLVCRRRIPEGAWLAHGQQLMSASGLGPRALPSTEALSPLRQCLWDKTE